MLEIIDKQIIAASVNALVKFIWGIKWLSLHSNCFLMKKELCVEAGSHYQNYQLEMSY